MTGISLSFLQSWVVDDQRVSFLIFVFRLISVLKHKYY